MLMMDTVEVKLQTLPKQVAGVLARRIAGSGVAGAQGPSEQPSRLPRRIRISRARSRERR